jgi:hypothetical protein
MLAQGGYGAAMGALWALVDLEDPMAADVLAEAVAPSSGEVISFPELWPMLSRAGDARVIEPLLDVMVTAPDSLAAEASRVLGCIAHRIGRDAFREALIAEFGLDADDRLPADLERFIEALYEVDEAEVQSYYRYAFEGLTMEELWADAMQDEDAMSWDPTLDDPEELGLLWDEEEAVWEPDHSPVGREGAPERKPSVSLGRNDPCWCGSGKKYKHCHWRSDQQDALGRVQTG